MRLEFFIPMEPPSTTHQQKQVHVANGKPHFYEPPELKAARSKLMAHLAPHAPAEPIQDAVRLLAKWCFPIVGNRKNGE